MSAVLGFDMVLKFANVCDIYFRVENEKHRPTRQVMFSNHEKNNYSEEHYRRRSKVKTQNHTECKFIIYSKKELIALLQNYTSFIFCTLHMIIHI